MTAATDEVYAALRSRIERQFAGYDAGDATKAVEGFAAAARLVAADGSEHDLVSVITQAVAAVDAEFARPRHEVSNVCVDVHRGELISETYVNGFVYTQDADGSWHEILHRCRYLDRWTDGPDWKILERRLIHDQHLLDGQPQPIP